MPWGPAPLTVDRSHAQRVADLQVYVRQHHAERDLARIGADIAAGVRGMVSFDHRDPGTDEGAWAGVLRDGLPAMELDVDRPLVVVAAHPDDETLGAAGLIATAAARGIRIDLLVVTDGEGSHPDSPTHSPATLALLRRRELRAEAAIVGAEREPMFLGCPTRHRRAPGCRRGGARSRSRTRALEEARASAFWCLSLVAR